MRQKKQIKMFSLVQEWEGSQQTKQEFCKAHQLNPTTFHYWIQKYNKYSLPEEQDLTAGQTSPFVALSISDSRASIEQDDHSVCRGVELNYPNGVHLRLSGPVSIAYLSSLIKLS